MLSIKSQEDTKSFIQDFRNAIRAIAKVSRVSGL